ncbi:potassium channel subfamily K member 7 isoform X2 [Eptesicus fuscus]|uniref:potassium channel subfamily K member 7 isoform X2 n=1 Tax=Eptesicus fuscus TaxID=29078 RepID=UPI002403AE01|nr:potassium channel subfamily K member 7 isoform X2 [Eptesicus fuscus]
MAVETGRSDPAHLRAWAASSLPFTHPSGSQASLTLSHPHSTSSRPHLPPSQLPEVEQPASRTPQTPRQHTMGALRPWARYGLLMAAHLLALGLGAAVLQALEGPPARRLQAQLRAELATFQAEYGACLPTGALEELLGTALAAQAHGISSLGNVSKAGNWDLPSALLFTASILTTTGYGHMAPLSAGGKAFCVVYAALGLPASLALVATLRHGLLPLLSCPVAWAAVRWQLTPAGAALLQALGLGLLVAGTFVLLPALLLWGLQGSYSLLEAIYFCFGSLSTIGLGDLLPGRGRDLNPVLYHLGQIALLGYLLLGLLAMLLAVETFSELPQVRALVKFFGSSGPLTAEDQGGILGQDELALSTLPPSAAAPEQAPPADRC